MKQCTECGVTKTLGDFRKNARGPMPAKCKQCHHKLCAVWAKRKYWSDAEFRYQQNLKRRWRNFRSLGVVFQSYEHFLELMAQVKDGTCQVCGKAGTKMCIDHDHVTMKVRGVLCDTCNRGIGLSMMFGSRNGTGITVAAGAGAACFFQITAYCVMRSLDKGLRTILS